MQEKKTLERGQEGKKEIYIFHRRLSLNNGPATVQGHIPSLYSVSLLSDSSWSSLAAYSGSNDSLVARRRNNISIDAIFSLWTATSSAVMPWASYLSIGAPHSIKALMTSGWSQYAAWWAG